VDRDAIGSLPFFADKTIRLTERIEPEKHANALTIVETETDRYVVRTLLRGETDPAVEYAVSRRAAQEGIAPEAQGYDPERSTMILEWVEGAHKHVLDRDDLDLLAATLKRLHGIDTEEQPLPRTQLNTIIEIDEPSIAEAFASLAHFPRHDVLCHHDLNPLNLLWHDGSVQLIDFEYARINDRCFDLASVCVEFGLTEAEARYFVEVYLDGEEFDGEKIMAYITLYEALCKQWNNAQT
jgi:aminoglycoside phosphotransferase (APT) family kinase protein